MNFYCTTEYCSCIGIKQFSAGKVIRCTAESCKNKSEPSCGSCKWYAEFEGVCVNDQSEHVADFVWDERGCKEWEKKDERKQCNQAGQWHSTGQQRETFMPNCGQVLLKL